MVNLSESNRGMYSEIYLIFSTGLSFIENLVMDELHSKRYFQHSWWRILLILLAFISFIITCIFNGLASNGPNGMNFFLKK
jgi:hypothetical protein